MGGNRPSQGLRLNGGKKNQILRDGKDEDANTYVVYGKIVSELKYRSSFVMSSRCSVLTFTLCDFVPDKGWLLHSKSWQGYHCGHV